METFAVYLAALYVAYDVVLVDCLMSDELKKTARYHLELWEKTGAALAVMIERNICVIDVGEGTEEVLVEVV